MNVVVPSSTRASASAKREETASGFAWMSSIKSVLGLVAGEEGPEGFSLDSRREASEESDAGLGFHKFDKGSPGEEIGGPMTDSLRSEGGNWNEDSR